MLSFYIKVFYVMGKALSGELSCPCDRSCYTKSLQSYSRNKRMKRVMFRLVTLGAYNHLAWKPGYFNPVALRMAKTP